MIGDQWGVSDAEVQRRYGCDDLVPEPTLEAWRGVTVHAPAEAVWERVRQVRVAPYSYDLVDNLGRRSPRALLDVPDPRVGDPFTRAFGRDQGRVVAVDPGRELTAEIMGAQGTEWGRFLVEQILGRTGADHRRMRDLLAPLFTPRVANRHRPLMQATIAALLDEWAPKGAFDFEEFASYFPITVMCSLIGASPEVLPKLRSSLETLGLSFNMIPDFLPKLEEAVETLDAFVTQLVADRRAGQRLTPQPDLLDALIAANDAGQLSDVEMNNLLIFLFVAGYDTSKNVLTLIMHELLTRPEPSRPAPRPRKRRAPSLHRSSASAGCRGSARSSSRPTAGTDSSRPAGASGRRCPAG